jgi:hypothetical protein
VNEAKYYYLDRAAYLRGLAQDAQSPQLRMSCLKAAADYDALAEKAQKDDALPGRAGRDASLRH